MSGYDPDGIAQTEANYFEKCPVRGEWFDVRDVAQMALHIHDLTGVEINHSNLVRTPEVHVQLFPRMVNDHAFIRVAREPGDFTNDLKRFGIDNSERV